MKSNVTQQRVPVTGDAGHWVHVSESPRHVRVIYNDETIADSKHAKLVRETEVLPVYYFPQEDVRTELLSPSQRRSELSLQRRSFLLVNRARRQTGRECQLELSRPTGRGGRNPQSLRLRMEQNGPLAGGR